MCKPCLVADMLEGVNCQPQFWATVLGSGDIPEEAYYQQQKVQVDVLDLFRMVDQAANGALTATLPQREIRVLLKGRLPITHRRPEGSILFSAPSAILPHARPPASLDYKTGLLFIFLSLFFNWEHCIATHMLCKIAMMPAEQNCCSSWLFEAVWLAA